MYIINKCVYIYIYICVYLCVFSGNGKESEPDTRADDLLRHVASNFAWQSAPRHEIQGDPRS